MNFYVNKRFWLPGHWLPLKKWSTPTEAFHISLTSVIGKLTIERKSLRKKCKKKHKFILKLTENTKMTVHTMTNSHVTLVNRAK